MGGQEQPAGLEAESAAVHKERSESLLELYERWRAREVAQEQAQSEAAVDPDELEAKAMRKSRRLFRSLVRLDDIKTRPAALAAFTDYRQRGGRLDLEGWVIRLIQQTTDA